MWCVVHKGNIYNRIESVNEVVNLVYRLTNDWQFAKYLNGYLPTKEVDWEEDFEEQITYIWRYR